jgi:hypothetical protein
MEKEHNPTNLFNELFKLTEVQGQLLSERIKKWEGTIRLFVHPSFMGLNHHSKALEKFGGHEKVEEVILRLLSLEEEKTPPIFIMEEHSNLEKSAQLYNRQATQKALFIETEDSDPDLFGKPDGFSELADLFSRLGVTKILIGGQVLWIDINELEDAGNVITPQKYGYGDQKPWLGGCAGKTIIKLNDPRFTIEISHISYPDRPSKMRDIF